MAAVINTYTGCSAAMLAWIMRETDTRIAARFDDFLMAAENRIYYGYATNNPDDPLHSEPLRIVEMETVVQSDDVAEGDTTIAQPSDFLELISVYTSTLTGPMEIVSQRTIDGYGSQSIGGTRLIAVSGTNFRLFDAAPADLTLIMRYYRMLTTPTPAAANDIMTKYPMVYLYGVLIEAAIFQMDENLAAGYLRAYNSQVSGLNARTQRITASSNPVMRVRAGMLP